MENRQPHHSPQSLEDLIRERLAPSGLMPLGWFETDGAPALLIGNVGSSLWPAFSISEQYSDGLPDPLNRWTVSKMSILVDDLPPEIVQEVRYPFGEPIWPFQQYAKRALGIEQSPLGLLIHPEFGLWFAFRAVLVFGEGGVKSPPMQSARDHPCDACSDKPCLNTCPIGAFSVDAYDYPGCKNHVGSPAGEGCFRGGCLARQACPVGREFTNEQTHQAFHMRAMFTE